MYKLKYYEMILWEQITVGNIKAIPHTLQVLINPDKAGYPTTDSDQPSLDARDENGDTFFMHALKCGKPEVIETLFDNLNFNQLNIIDPVTNEPIKNNSQQTVLDVLNQCEPVVKKVFLNSVDKDGKKFPYYLLVKRCEAWFIDWVKAYPMILRIFNKNNQNLLHFSCAFNLTNAAKIILILWPAYNDGLSPLMLVDNWKQRPTAKSASMATLLNHFGYSLFESQMTNVDQYIAMHLNRLAENQRSSIFACAMYILNSERFNRYPAEKQLLIRNICRYLNLKDLIINQLNKLTFLNQLANLEPNKVTLPTSLPPELAQRIPQAIEILNKLLAQRSNTLFSIHRQVHSTSNSLTLLPAVTITTSTISITTTTSSALITTSSATTAAPLDIQIMRLKGASEQLERFRQQLEYKYKGYHQFGVKINVALAVLTVLAILLFIILGLKFKNVNSTLLGIVLGFLFLVNAPMLVLIYNNLCSESPLLSNCTIFKINLPVNFLYREDYNLLNFIRNEFAQAFRSRNLQEINPDIQDLLFLIKHSLNDDSITIANLIRALTNIVQFIKEKEITRLHREAARGHFTYTYPITFFSGSSRLNHNENRLMPASAESLDGYDPEAIPLMPIRRGS